MSTSQTVRTSDPAWEGLYGVGAVSSILAGILGLITPVLVLAEGTQPNTAEAALRFVAQVEPLQRAAILVFTLIDFFFIPTVLALYFALKDVRKTSMLLATALFGTFIVIDLGVDDVNFYSLAILGSKFVAATSDVQKASYVAAADLANATLSGGFLLHGIPLSIATIIVGSVMLKGIFSKGTAYLSIIAGVVGLIAYPFTAFSGIGLPLLIFGILTSIWLMAVGLKLYRLR